MRSLARTASRCAAVRALAKGLATAPATVPAMNPPTGGDSPSVVYNVPAVMAEYSENLTELRTALYATACGIERQRARSPSRSATTRIARKGPFGNPSFPCCSCIRTRTVSTGLETMHAAEDAAAPSRAS
eukprot:scaffold109040_cov36-Tisochrysis_lutea.AAC.1